MKHAHAIERAWERHGLEMSESDFEEVIVAIRKGQSILQGTLVGGLERRIVRVKGKILPIVFAPIHGYVVTVLSNFKMRRSS